MMADAIELHVAVAHFTCACMQAAAVTCPLLLAKHTATINAVVRDYDAASRL